MKKKILVLAGLALCAAMAATGTMAYFTADAQAHNVITTGGVGIEIVETKQDGSPFENLSGVMPGTEEYKVVTVQNTKDAPAWIRVSVITSIRKDGAQTDSAAQLPLTITAGSKTVNAVELVVEKSGGGFDKLADSASWRKNWTLGADGCYYYNFPVAPGESTAPLFQAVHFAKEMGNEYQSCKVYLDISAQAVQSDNNPIPTGGSVTDLKDWPNT